jgi:hypothetical protein
VRHSNLNIYTLKQPLKGHGSEFIAVFSVMIGSKGGFCAMSIGIGGH